MVTMGLAVMGRPGTMIVNFLALVSVLGLVVAVDQAIIPEDKCTTIAIGRKATAVGITYICCHYVDKSTCMK